MRFLLVCILLFCLGACKKPTPNHLNNLTPLKNPLVYARYETLPALLRTKPGACTQAYAFKIPDYYKLSKIMDLCGPLPQKNLWIVQSGVQSFLWEQDIQEGEKLQLEIIGPQGIPLPSTATVSKIGSRVLIQLKLSENLLSKSVLTIVATLLDASGAKLGTWSVPFKISSN
ncbi:MAG: hypothetical protein WCK42_04480 [Myxococcaceae bacterium]